MGRNNFKISETINSSIVSFTKNNQNESFIFELKIKVNKNSDVIFKNSTTIEECFKINRILSLKEINFDDVNKGSIDESAFEKNGKILSVDNSNLFSGKEITIQLEIKPISDILFISLTGVNPNSTNNIVFMKVGAKKHKNTSGYLSKGFKKILNNKDFKSGVLPSSRITTGKILRSNAELPFIDSSTISFGANKINVNSTIGLPITRIRPIKNFNEYYIDLKNNQTAGIHTSNPLFQANFSLSNSDLINSPHDLGDIDNIPRLTKKVESDQLDSVLNQRRFEEEIKENEPFNDSIYEEAYNNTESFYNETIDPENKKNYNVLNQKKIKIELDFSGDIDLQLLNTKFAFNRKDPSNSKSDFTSNQSKDEIVNTNFFNFTNETAYSISSHFMPTAYWDNHNKRWTYLEGIKPLSNNFNAILGHRNNYSNGILFNKDYTSSIGLEALVANLMKEQTDIISDFSFYVFAFGNFSTLRPDLITIKRNHRNIRSAIHYSKSLLTTPGFRNDGSFVKSNMDDSLNKLPICQITDSYGFPYKANWQPHQNHMIKMSDYIGKNFLLEKVIIKGKYSSKGEMPVKKGNFYSGYLKTENSSDVNSLTDFNSTYTMKDNHQDYISNSLTFFILNERKAGLNYIDDKVKIEPLQHYNYIIGGELSQNDIDNDSSHESNYNTNGKNLKDYLGDYISNNSLKVLSHIVPSRNLYSVDNYNNLISSQSVYFDSKVNNSEYNFNIGSFNKSNFFFLSNNLNPGDLNGEDPEFVYIKSHDTWSDNNFSHNTIQESNKTHIIRQSYSEDLDTNRTRDLVTYSNMVITAKTDSIELDENIFKNIDTHIIKNQNSNVLNLNVSESSPEEFTILSFCKNQMRSKYSDESEYKLKSNYYETDANGTDTEFYNHSYNLEGKSLGEANQLGLLSDRVINKEELNYENRGLKSKSGKILQNRDEPNAIVKSNYLLKPEDNLIFGVTSNCNGQVMPTAFRLHDKIEITLIGRDYVNDVQYKNNESDAIRKTVIGDDYIEKSGSTIYQTKGNYYDNVFSLDQEEANKDLFYSRDIIDKKSSRKFGTYTGVLTSAEEYTHKAAATINIDIDIQDSRRKYIRDTVNFSLGHVYDNIFKQNDYMNLIDIKDARREFNKKSIKNISLFNAASSINLLDFDNPLKSSRKIIITENTSLDHTINDLENSIFANNIINNWHKKYHLEEYKNNLRDDILVINDFTVNYVAANDIESLIYYDTSSYLIDLNLFEKKIIKDVNQEYILSRLFEANQPNNEVQETVESRYQSIKSFCLPNSSLRRYQNGIQIQNFESFSNSIFGTNPDAGFTNKEYKSFLVSDKVIEEITSVHSKVQVNQPSLQYFNSNMNVLEYCEQTENCEISTTTFSPYYSPQWHLVFEISQSNFSQLILNLSVENKRSILNSPIGKLIDVFLFENNTDSSQMVLKTAKIIRRINISTNNTIDYVYQLAIPLYFWETLEIEQSFFSDDNNISYGRFENRTNSVEYDNSTPMWFTTLNDGSSLKSIKDSAYAPFINNTLLASLGTTITEVDNLTEFFPYTKLGERIGTVPSTTSDLLINNANVFPYRIEDGTTIFINVDANNNTTGSPISTNSINEKLILSSKNYYISLCSFNNVGSTRSKENPVINLKNNSSNLLDNFYKLKYNSRVFSHRKYFENNLSEIDLKNQNSLGDELSGTRRFLNEKVYRSKIYKNSVNGFIETNEFLVYKIHEMTANIKSTVTNPPANKYIIIEPVAFDTDNKLLNKDYIDVNAPLLNIENTDTIRIYEDKLKEFSYADHHGSGINETPYFEINLNSKSSLLKTTLDSDNNIVKNKYDGTPSNETGVSQLPYYYHNIEESILFKTFNDETQDYNYESPKLISDLYDNNLIGASNKNINKHLRRYGTPIFQIEVEPKNYTSLQSQEDRIKNFFYGFCRGKSRYPIEKLDGFKYGVQNGSKLSNKFHFSNKRFGHFADKIQGSTNTVSVYNNDDGKAEFDERPVNKKFVNEYYENISPDNHTMSFNKDLYARSTYPYIENKEDILSQLNSNNSFYDENTAVRF